MMNYAVLTRPGSSFQWHRSFSPKLLRKWKWFSSWKKNPTVILNCNLSFPTRIYGFRRRRLPEAAVHRLCTQSLRSSGRDGFRSIGIQAVSGCMEKCQICSDTVLQVGLRQLDLSLLCQLWSLHEGVEALRAALPPSSPTPSEPGSPQDLDGKPMDLHAHAESTSIVKCRALNGEARVPLYEPGGGYLEIKDPRHESVH